jgi:hypothetical protein
LGGRQDILRWIVVGIRVSEPVAIGVVGVEILPILGEIPWVVRVLATRRGACGWRTTAVSRIGAVGARLVTVGAVVLVVVVRVVVVVADEAPSAEQPAEPRTA